MENHDCEFCGSVFQRNPDFWKPRRFCSSKCGKAAWYQDHKKDIRKRDRNKTEKTTRICPVCGEEFETQNRNRRYCDNHRNLSLTDSRRHLKDLAVKYKGGECHFCGYSRCAGALKFHHVAPEEKDFEIAKGSVSWDRIRAELDKCLLVCGNCHDEIHSGLLVV